MQFEQGDMGEAGWGGGGRVRGIGAGGHQLSSQNLFSHEVCVCVRSPGEAGSEESTGELGFFFCLFLSAQGDESFRGAGPDFILLCSRLNSMVQRMYPEDGDHSTVSESEG